MRISVLVAATIAFSACGCLVAPVAQPQTAAKMDMGASAPSKANPAGPGSAHALQGDEEEFQTIKKLVGGRWEAPLKEGGTIVDTFEPFDAGNYILGKEFVGGKQITTTVFYMVDGELRADHYCDYGNQPRYKVVPTADPSIVDMEFRDATDLDAHPRHFHSTVWHFIDATHMTQEWRVSGGPKSDTSFQLDFVRKESGTSARAACVLQLPSWCQAQPQPSDWHRVQPRSTSLTYALTHPNNAPNGALKCDGFCLLLSRYSEGGSP